MGSTTTDPDVLTFIAGRVSTNIRELEGALRPGRGVLLADRVGELTVELAEQVLRDLFPQGDDAPEVTIQQIRGTVSERFGLSVSELCSPRGARKRSPIPARSRCTCRVS